MRIHRIILVLFCTLLSSFVGKAQQQLDLIPKPAQMTISSGTYILAPTVNIYASEEFMSTAELFSEYPTRPFVEVQKLKSLKKNIKESFRILKATDSDKLNENAYLLQIDETGILLKAHQPQALIHGIYTLVQMGMLADHPESLPYVHIIDEPQFSYRGMHLDVSRHFLPISFIKKFVDIMAIYKFNNLHWHLTDGAGWRIEVKKYPELTSKAAWRTHSHWKDWWNNGRQYVSQGSPNASGGFYTQEQAADLVAYAQRKGINIIPEIEMPGHSEEVIAVYPELACTGNHNIQGEFCIGNEKTFEFLKNVIDEMLPIFPSPYIHIGGDEANKKHWKDCPKCQDLMHREGLKNVDELQSYAIKQMDEYLQAQGRKLIGWDEILEGGLTKGATVMSWRGEEGGIKAANSGHDVIMTPGNYLYFDSYQTDPRTQPETIGGYLPLEKVYSYYPVPASIEKDKVKHILGAQANLWSEYMTTFQQVEYMAFPRALALAEVNWTNPSLKSFPNFKQRLQSHYKLLQDLDVNYYRPSYNVDYQVKFNAKKFSNTVSLSSEQVEQSNIHYTIDGSKPSFKTSPYVEPFELSIPTVVRAAYFLDSIQVSPEVVIELDVHKAIGKKVTYNNKNFGNYPAQHELTLTNGIKGGLTYHDQQWQGFLSDLDIVVDFERREEISNVAMNFMQMTGPGVYMPTEFKVFLSDNGQNFREVGVIKNTVPDDDPKLIIKRFDLKLAKSQPARYVKVIATNTKGGFLFADEIIVY